MNKKGIVKILGILFFVTLSFVLLSKPIIPVPEVYAVSCPAGMDPESQACLTYLQNRLAEIQSQQSSIRKKLNNEQYQQLSLQEKITYMTNQIEQTEKVVKSLEVQIAANDVEIKLLEKDILEKEDSVSILRQETDILEKTVNQRITESYKYSFVGPLEIFLDVKSLSSALRRTKYLIATRSQDMLSLQEYLVVITDLKKEEEALTQNRAQVQIKRNEIEEEKLELAKEVNTLASQKSEQNRLLAESKAVEAELQAKLKTLIVKSNDINNQITIAIMALFHAGLIPVNTPVNAGDIIGFQGHTGFAYGSHLHFNMSGISDDPFDLGYLRLSGGKVYNGKLLSPLGQGAYLTQGLHSGYSIDMVGTSNWNYKRYSVSKNSVCCYGRCIPAGDYNLNGEGTPIIAVKSGKVSKVTTDPCGGKYVIIDHGKGVTSLYLHLK